MKSENIRRRRDRQFRRKYGPWFIHKDGIKGFADQAIAWFVEAAVTSALMLIEKIKHLKEEQRILQARKQHLLSQKPLQDKKYNGIGENTRMVMALVLIMLVAEVFLNYVAMLVILPGNNVLFSGIRWATAIMLTGLAAGSAKYFFEVISPSPVQESIDPDATNKRKQLLQLITGSIIFLVMEFIVMGISHKRAVDVEGEAGGWVYLSLVLLSGLIPFFTGLIWWLRNHKYDPYRIKKKIKRIDMQLETIQKAIDGAGTRLENGYKKLANMYWAIVAEFRDYKMVYNQRKKLENEKLDGHFASNRDRFISEAYRQYKRRFEAEIKASKRSSDGHTPDISGLISVATLVIMLTGCVPEPATRLNFVCPIDYSTSVSTETLAENAKIIEENIFLRFGERDKLTVVPIDDGAAIQPEKIVFEDLQQQTFRKESDGLVHAEDSAKLRLDTYLRGRSSSVSKGILNHRESRKGFGNRTDIFGSLMEAERLLAKPTVPEPEAITYNYIILFSDMIQESKRYNFDRKFGQQYLQEVLEELKKEGQIPDLQGVKVLVHGKTGRTKEQVQNIQRFWEAYFHAAGAELGAYEYDCKEKIRAIF